MITGAAFACLFVPLTTAALRRLERHLMADAAGLNSFVRQIAWDDGQDLSQLRAGLSAEVKVHLQN